MAINREIYQRAYRMLQELESDPVSILMKAEEIYKIAVTNGFYEETLSPATGEVVSLHKFAPSVGIQALQIKNQTVKRIHEELEKEESQGTIEDRTLVINLSELKVNRE